MEAWKIMSESLPAWYELGIEGTTLFIDVRSEHVPQLDKAGQGWAASGRFRPPHTPFTAYGRNRWGYNSVLKTDRAIRPGWARFSCALPVVIRRGDTNPAWEAIYDIAQSLHHLLSALQHIDHVSTNDQPQLMLVDVAAFELLPNQLESTGCFCEVRVGLPMICWINRHPEADLSSVSKAMQCCYRRMHQISRNDLCYQCMTRAPKWLYLQTFGDACGLDPGDPYDERVDYGYELVPHNLDTPLQVLSLLAGLAALHQLIRNTP